MALYNSSVANVSSVAYVDRPDLSRAGQPAPADGDVAAVIYIDIQVRPGMAPQFEAFARQLVEATDTAAPDAYWNMMMTSFGPGGHYRAVVVVDDWEDLNTPAIPAPQRLVEHFGAVQGSGIDQEGRSAVESIHVKLRRTRPDLARQAGN
jgi:hypothetical protein